MIIDKNIIEAIDNCRKVHGGIQALAKTTGISRSIISLTARGKRRKLSKLHWEKLQPILAVTSEIIRNDPKYSTGLKVVELIHKSPPTEKQTWWEKILYPSSKSEKILLAQNKTLKTKLDTLQKAVISNKLRLDAIELECGGCHREDNR